MSTEIDQAKLVLLAMKGKLSDTNHQHLAELNAACNDVDEFVMDIAGRDQDEVVTIGSLIHLQIQISEVMDKML